jgi:DNA-binding NtrC family response regulator
MEEGRAPDPFVSPFRKSTGADMETILIVDDNPGGRDLAKEILATAGYTVLEAASVDEARAAIRSGRTIDLVITDIVLPKVRGTALARELAQQQSHIKILLTSGYLDQGETGEPADLDNVPFLQKPFTSKALKEKVRAVLDAGRTS